MKAIILAAGRGTRMKPLTDTIPKPLISIAGKPIIEYSIEHLYTQVDEIIIIIKYLGNKIKEYFGDNYKGTKITYFEQGEDKGTAAALRGIKCNDDVFIIYGDQILDKKDYDSVINYNGYGALAKKVSQPSKYGIYKLNSEGFAEELVEKPSKNIGNLANIGGFKFSSKIFSIVKDIPLSPRGEYEIPDALNIFLENNDFKVFEAEGEFIDIGTAQDIDKAEDIFKKQNYKKPLSGEYKVIEKSNGYRLVLGIPANQIETLINYSQDLTDKDLQENTGDLQRFSTKKKFINWYNDENRFLFSMLDNNGKLAGIYWGRPTKFPIIKEIVNQEAYNIVEENKNNIHTNGIRIYPDYRGKGLAKFLFKAEDHYENIFPSPYWSTDISSKNIASCKGFERKGYTHIANGKNINNGKINDDNRRIYIKIPS